MPFDKSLSVLRETFVRARFGEEKYFNNPDIERWLYEQCGAEAPDEVGWNHCLSTDAMLFAAKDDLIGLLREHAAPARIVPFAFGRNREEFWAEMEHRSRLSFILQGFDLAEVEVYYPYVHGPILVSTRYPLGFYLQGGEENLKPITIIKELASPMVMDAIFAEWWRQTPKAGMARAFLTVRLEQEIRKVRAEAESEFDRAVAVSPDGTKIVHADAVVVLQDNPRRRLVYNASVFAQEKIERSNLKRINPTFDVDQMRIAVEQSGCEQAFFDLRAVCRLGPDETLYGLKNSHVLVVRERLCPGPLPEGGVLFSEPLPEPDPDLIYELSGEIIDRTGATVVYTKRRGSD